MGPTPFLQSPACSDALVLALDFLHSGAFPSLRSYSQLEVSPLVSSFAQFGLLLPPRSLARPELPTSAPGVTQADSLPLSLDYATVGFLLPLQSYVCLGLVMSVSDFSLFGFLLSPHSFLRFGLLLFPFGTCSLGSSLLVLDCTSPGPSLFLKGFS